MNAIQNLKDKIVSHCRPETQHGMPTRQIPVAYADMLADFINEHPGAFREFCVARGYSSAVARSALACLRRGWRRV